MKILVYSLIGSDRIRQLIGIAEYSYYYVLKEFLPLLEQFGEVIVIGDPVAEVDELYEKSIAAGEQCMFFSFTTPHSVPRGLRCPTVVVFAWEYDSIPNESWDGNEDFNWVQRINAVGAVITHSRYTLATIEKVADKRVMTEWLPAPVWNRMQDIRRDGLLTRPRKTFVLSVAGSFLESRWIDLRQLDELDEKRRRSAIAIPKIAPLLMAGEAAAQNRAVQPDPVEISFAGVIYTALLNPYDGRKNWQLMVEAFCSAFRDVDDATLLIKVSANHLIEFSDAIMEYLRRFAPVKCRIVLLQAYLGDDQYAALVRGTTYYVNTSYCEGQCLPLMEFMSFGVPAIAPRTTALGDYVRPWNAFVLRAHREPATWQHDPRQKFRTHHYRVEYASLEQAFRRSYAIASHRRWRLVYHLLQIGAIISLRQHCSMKVCVSRLSRFLTRLERNRIAGA